jgi:cytochrome b involved in lipid metabolism
MKYFLVAILVILIAALVFLGYWLFKNQKHKLFEFMKLSEYSIDEIEKHNTKESLWFHYEGHVYDITKFITQHPGGSVILKAGGKNLKSVWEEQGVEWHMKKAYVMNTLEKYKIGILKV